MTDYMIVLPNQLFYVEEVFRRLVQRHVKEIIIAEAPQYLQGSRMFVISQLAAMRRYEDILNDLIKKTGSSATVTYITLNGKFQGNFLAYMTTLKIMGKTWMCRPTLYDDKIWRAKPGSFQIEFYSSPSYVISSGDLMSRIKTGATIADISRRFKANIRGVVKNPVVMTDNDNLEKYHKDATRYYGTLVRNKRLQEMPSNGTDAIYPIDSYSALVAVNTHLIKLSNASKGKGALNYDFGDFIRSPIYNSMVMGIITPTVIIAALHGKRSIYVNIIKDCIMKREYLYYCFYKDADRGKVLGMRLCKLWNGPGMLDISKKLSYQLNHLVTNGCSDKSLHEFFIKQPLNGEIIFKATINNIINGNLENIFVKPIQPPVDQAN